MRPISEDERKLIVSIADRLDGPARQQLLADLKASMAEPVTPDGSRVTFAISGYIRPIYRGQHLFEVEGQMLDGDGADLSVLLHADESGRLLELELIRWDSLDLVGPKWETLRLTS